MPDYREAAIALVAMLGLLFVSDAFFGDGDPRFDNAFYDSAFYAPRSKEFRFASDITPAARVDDMFSQFFPSEGKRNKRYSSLTTIIR
ncbi:hypothetical protein JQ632_00885 [Bradyrhizobium liaoningense]|nr:hypothetical protein [Bradyrhizobium liaoningense]MBR0712502.1 hypothetical protein [Bradyrhizobium liaoningense]